MRQYDLHNSFNNKESILFSEFNQWIPSLFKRKVVFDNDFPPFDDGIDYNKYLSRHLYLVTMNFQGGVGIARNSWSPVRNALIFDSIFKGWYLSVTKRILGPRYNKKPQLQPFCMAFLDVEGTRHQTAPATFLMPHIHALLLIHPSNSSRFELLAKCRQFDQVVDKRIAKIDLRMFRDRDQSAERMMTYAAKYTRQTLTDGRHDKTWWVYPDLKPEIYPFYGTAGTGLPPKHPGKAGNTIDNCVS